MGIKGKCEEMCPKSEIKKRSEMGLLHSLEIKRGTEYLPKPLPDYEKMVKSFSRSAAGRETVNPFDLRTPTALLKTVNYLLFDVASMKLLPWNKIYDFIFDRLLAVRQDMVIQEVSWYYGISILQPIIKFYAYSSFRLCEYSVHDFDPYLNNRNLQECLKRLLILYDECDKIESRAKIIDSEYKENTFEILFKDCREFYEALYILTNLGNSECICRGLSIPLKWRCDLVKKAVKISINMRNGNWIRVCRLILELSPLLMAVTSLNLPNIRRSALLKMSVAYHSKNSCFPIESLQKSLLYSSNTDVLDECRRYQLESDNDCIKFKKDTFNSLVKPNTPKQENYIVEKCKDLCPTVILNDKFF